MADCEETFLYFAYGSNLLKQRLLLKNPSAVYVDVAKLQDYRLTFDSARDTKGSRWQGAGATIRQSEGEIVWGTVWRLNMSDSDHLDRQESSYKRVEVKVKAADDTVYTCRTYEMDGVFNIFNLPSPHYKDVIVRGAKQSGLPKEYVEKIEAHEDNGFKGGVPLYNEVIEMLQKQQS